MKNYLVMMVLVLLMISGMKTEGMTEESVKMSVSMSKDVFSGTETYGIRFDLSNDTLKKVTKVYVEKPEGTRIWVNNTLELNEIALSAANLTSTDFKRLFPKGTYKIALAPAVYGKLTANMTHNFPPTPTFTYPEDGGTDVPTNPKITWEWKSRKEITGLQLQLMHEGDSPEGDFLYSTGLPINITDFSVPAGVLKPATNYKLSLQAKVTDFSGNGLITTVTISFTTVKDSAE